MERGCQSNDRTLADGYQAELNCLELLGVDDGKLRQMRDWAAAGQAVTIKC